MIAWIEGGECPVLMKLAAWAIRLVYGVCSRFPQQRKIVFLSRQAARPFDFSLIEPELKRRFPRYAIVWVCVPKIGSLGALMLLKQVWHVATAELCLVDGYIPAVSIPERHRAFVVQMWHAPGAIKKFGYQSLDTLAGRTSSMARVMRMHRGYDIVIAGMPGAVEAFSEAFDVPRERIAPLGLPRIDYLLAPEFSELRTRRFARAREIVESSFTSSPRCAASAERRTTVLYAPTFRRGEADACWLEHAVKDLLQALHGTEPRLIVAGHPLDSVTFDLRESDVPVAFTQGVPTIDVLPMADFVATDYSTVAFEAGYAGKRVLFYVPDIEEYRLSPGLNIDPLLELPTIASANADDVARVVRGERDYDIRAFQAFMDAHARGVYEGSIDRICALLQDSMSAKRLNTEDRL